MKDIYRIQVAGTIGDVSTATITRAISDILEVADILNCSKIELTLKVSKNTISNVKFLKTLNQYVLDTNTSDRFMVVIEASAKNYASIIANYESLPMYNFDHVHTFTSSSISETIHEYDAFVMTHIDNPIHGYLNMITSTDIDSYILKDISEVDVLECHSHGDKRLSALFANITLNGKRLPIENWYQESKIKVADLVIGFRRIIEDDQPNDLHISKSGQFYDSMWVEYFLNHPLLFKDIKRYNIMRDKFKRRGSYNDQSSTIRRLAKFSHKDLLDYNKIF